MDTLIKARFDSNLERVGHLVEVYSSLRAPGRGRPTTQEADILRAAVVFLHASLEDLVRSLLSWKLPSAKAEHLGSIPLPGRPQRKSYNMKDLAEFRGKTVDDVIRDAVKSHLESSSYSSLVQIDHALQSIGGSLRLVNDTEKAELTALMKRRHWIVHRLDANGNSGSGHHPALPISLPQVRAWIETVRRAGQSIVDGITALSPEAT